MATQSQWVEKINSESIGTELLSYGAGDNFSKMLETRRNYIYICMYVSSLYMWIDYTYNKGSSGTEMRSLGIWCLKSQHMCLGCILDDPPSASLPYPLHGVSYMDWKHWHVTHGHNVIISFFCHNHQFRMMIETSWNKDPSSPEQTRLKKTGRAFTRHFTVWML